MLLNYVLKKLWLTLAIVLVISAATLTTLRFALPYFPNLADNVERFFYQQYQQSVNIESLAMSWSERGPSLVLNNVDFAAPEDTPVGISVDKVWVVIDFWQSLLQWKVKASTFILDGADIRYDMRQSLGESSEGLLDTVSKVFLAQLERFSVRDSQLTVTNLLGERRRIAIERLGWSNKQAQHQGVGQFRVEGFTTNSLDFILKLNGNDWATMNGQLYIDSRNIDLTPWLEQQITDTHIDSAELNFTAWLELRDGSLNEGLLQLRDNHVRWQADDAQHQLKLSRGNIVLRPQSQGWLLNSEPMQLSIDNEQWQIPPLLWQQIDGNNFASLTGLNVAPLLQLTNMFGLTSEQTHRALQQADPQGQVDVFLQKKVRQPWQWTARIKQLTLSAYNNIPSLSGLSAQFSGQGSQGRWRIAIDGSIEQQQWLTDAPLQLRTDSLQGTWKIQADGWLVTLPQGQLVINDWPLNIAGKLYHSGTEPNHIAVKVWSDKSLAATKAAELLPRAMGESTQQYLVNALVGGELDHITAAWRGDVGQFPEQFADGVFSARASFSRLDFKFQPDWPAIENAPMQLDFYQDGLYMHTQGGTMSAVRLDKVDAQIPNLADAQQGLYVQASVSGEAHDFHQLFSQSPLTEVSDTMEQVTPAGMLAGQFSLQVPFDEALLPHAEGTVRFDQNPIEIQAIDAHFDSASGTLRFNDSNISTDDLSLTWFGMPIPVTVNGSQQGKGYQVKAEALIDWQTDKLFNAMPQNEWRSLFYGAINGRGDLDLMLTEKGYSVDWNSQVDLTGLQTQLPAPLQKEFGEAWQWQFSLSGNEQQLQASSEIPDHLQWFSQWKPGAKQWDVARLRIGEPLLNSQMTKQDRFIVSAALPLVDVASWFTTINQIQQSMPTAEMPVDNNFSRPDLIQVTTPDLRWLGQSLTDAMIRIWPQNGLWHVRMDSNDGAIKAEIPSDYQSKGIHVVANRLVLNSWNEKTTSFERSPEQWLHQVPPLNIECRYCRYQEHEIGELRLMLSPLDNGLSLDDLRISNGDNRLAMSGKWLYDGEQPSTHISGTLKSDDLGQLLNEYKMNTIIKDSPADIRFDLSWQDLPYKVDVESLDGEVKWDLGKGYLADVSDGGARLFSIFSLESIVRQLTLDFRDIFSQGMFYTDLTGSLQIKDGIAATSDTKMQGSAGDMALTGTTNLTNSQLDYRLTYVPKVTSSLPVIVAWMVNPPAGLAALLLDKVLHDAQVISRLEYRITGTIDDPKVSEVSRDSRKVDLPNQASEPASKQPTSEQPEASNEGSTTNRNAVEQPATTSGKSEKG